MHSAVTVLADLGVHALQLVQVTGFLLSGVLPWWFWPVVFCCAMARTVGHLTTRSIQPRRRGHATVRRRTRRQHGRRARRRT